MKRQAIHLVLFPWQLSWGFIIRNEGKQRWLWNCWGCENIGLWEMLQLRCLYFLFSKKRIFHFYITNIFVCFVFFLFYHTKSGWGWYLLWVNISKSWHLNISVTCWKPKHFHELNIDWLWWWVRIHFVRFYIFLYISVPVCVSASTVFLQRLTPICKSMWIKSMDKNKSILELFPPTVWMNIYIQQKTSGKTGREMTLNVSLRAVEQIVLL